MLKNYCNISNQRPPNCLIAKFRAKIRILKFRTKNTLFGCFGQQFWKTTVIFEVSTLEFALLQSFVQKIKILKFRTKNARFPNFGTRIWKWYCYIWNQRPRISLVSKIKIFKSRTKNAWFMHFWAGISKQYCHIWNQHPQICLTAKFGEKNA